MRKRSITIDGHRTSVSLEDEFWQELAAIAGQRDMSLNALVTEIDRQRAGAQAPDNLSSALRVHVLKHAQRKISPA
jgi:predicted DNA-binding ribbon-helix-helix protein